MSASPSSPLAAPRAAATLVLVRDAAAGIEVLLVQRAERGDRNSGAWVFPGGIVDAGDGAAQDLCAGLTEAQASARLDLAEGGLAFHVAALRECFEEVGLLLVCDAQGAPLAVGAALAARLEPLRTALHRGEATLATLCERAGGARLAVDGLAYLSHWLTPIGLAKRFDTRFFVAEAPQGQHAVPDGSESVALRWLRPADALANHDVRGNAGMKLMTPTLATLRTLARFDSVHALMSWARAPRDVAVTLPRLGTGAKGKRPVMPDEPAWAELGRIDPEGHGNGSCALRPGVAVRLSERVIRVSADNGSVMTGPGTNTYLLASGNAQNEWAAIDPGPDDADHVRAILAAAPGPIGWIFATHTHLDHSPACAALHAATGAPVHGRIAAHPEWQDKHFAPQVLLSGGERIALGQSTTLRVIHTPGHASNHLCYLLEEEKTLFTGDHVMQSSTVVINPPDGDMAAYIASLRELLSLDLDWLGPGHGFLMADPRRAIQAIIEHRGKREAKVIDALRDLGPAAIDALLAQVYDDVPARMHGVATRSLRAHLIKLCVEGRAVDQAGGDAECWSLAR